MKYISEDTDHYIGNRGISSTGSSISSNNKTSSNYDYGSNSSKNDYGSVNGDDI